MGKQKQKKKKKKPRYKKQVYDTGEDFLFQVWNTSVKFKAVNLRGRTWSENREDYNFYSVVFDEPVTTTVCVEIWAHMRLKGKNPLIRRAFIDVERKGYREEKFGDHTFLVHSTHELHLVDPEKKTWDRMSFGLVNRQIAYGKGMREECYPQWLFDADFDPLFERATKGLMHGLPFSPLDPEYFDPELIPPVKIPQKTPNWHVARKDKIGSSTAYKVGMGCFTSGSSVVLSNRGMRAGSILEDAIAMVFVQHTGFEYYEKGWFTYEPYPKWGDSIDGVVRNKFMKLERVPKYVKEHWVKNGKDLKKLDMTMGGLEIKCSDKDKDIGMRGYYIGQCVWHMMNWDVQWCILLKGQPCGKNGQLWAYLIWRDYDLEKTIRENVLEGTKWKEAGKLAEWGRKDKIYGLNKKYLKKSFGITANREKNPQKNFKIDWPTPEVKEYLSLIPDENRKLETLPKTNKDFPQSLVKKLSPVLFLNGHGWMHEYPVVYEKGPEEQSKMDDWLGKPEQGKAYTQKQAIRKEEKQEIEREKKQALEKQYKEANDRMDKYRDNARKMKKKGSDTGWIKSKPSRKKRKVKI